MKKVAVIFVLAVLAPSLVLAWLAVRSARDQQMVVAQQQSLLYQGVAEALAKDVRDYMAVQQREFAQFVESQRRNHSTTELATRFDILSRGVIAASTTRRQLKKSNLLTFYNQALVA